MMRGISSVLDLIIIDAIPDRRLRITLADKAYAGAFQDFYFILQFPFPQFAFEPALFDLEDPSLNRSFIDWQQNMGAINAHLPPSKPR